MIPSLKFLDPHLWYLIGKLLDKLCILVSYSPFKSSVTFACSQCWIACRVKWLIWHLLLIASINFIHMTYTAADSVSMIKWLIINTGNDTIYYKCEAPPWMRSSQYEQPWIYTLIHEDACIFLFEILHYCDSWELFF